MSFSITNYKGFHLYFENKWGVSVQFGPGDYCDHHSKVSDCHAPSKAGVWKSEEAEVAVFRPDGEFAGGDVFGYIKGDAVAKLLHYISRLKTDTTEEDAVAAIRLSLSEDISFLEEIEFETRK